MAEKAKHAFGALERVDDAIANKKIDAYDILFVTDTNGKPYVGWVDKDGNKVIVDDSAELAELENQIATKANAKDVEAEFATKASIDDVKANFATKENVADIKVELETKANAREVEAEFATKANTKDVEAGLATKADAKEVNEKIDKVATDTVTAAKAYTDGKVEAAVNEHLIKRYEISNTPDGTLVDYREKEIRVMCPSNAVFTKQSVGSTGNANMYYMAFKAYAPDGAVSFKEGDRGVIVDEMFTFDDDFAGTDEYGRNYSICWLALASYDEASNTWSYFGKTSSFNKYIGWTYCVEWYDADGMMIASDSVRINLSNETCHSEIKPYYMADISKEIDTKIEKRIAEVESACEVVEF